MELKLGGWVGAWANFVFWSNLWQVLMIGICCMSFFVLTDVLARTWLKLGGWVELAPTRIYEVILW